MGKALRTGALEARPPVRPLTSRESSILQLLAAGVSTSHIAERLHLAIQTVNLHRRNILRKLNLRNLAELTQYAIRKGLAST